MLIRRQVAAIMIAALVGLALPHAAHADSYDIDKRGRLRAVTPAIGNAMYYTYDPVGNVKYVDEREIRVDAQSPVLNLGMAYASNTVGPFEVTIYNNSEDDITINELNLANS